MKKVTEEEEIKTKEKRKKESIVFSVLSGEGVLKGRASSSPIGLSW